MSGADQRKERVRRLLDTPPPPVPPGLVAEAVRRGERLRRLRAGVLRLFWVVLAAAATGLTVWLLAARPWAAPEVPVIPPPTDW
ncbi:hypothetical protein ACWGSE_00605 [Streptomyces diastaticus]|uniref:hypothetical protein n=1 Tax=Streptomyces TaxID=1883 RepID=UPI0018ACE21C|nr:hypothetical protein [Streptomyces sp. BRB081]MBL3806550.1 hypothetical protein [Streptomyces sp. BRB081]